jgi:hypothetical protein
VIKLPLLDGSYTVRCDYTDRGEILAKFYPVIR